MVQDLDKATQKKLERGKRTVEVFKQSLYNPLPVEYQVVILYALVHGYLDDIEVDQVNRFEKDLYLYLASNELGQEIVQEIKQTKDLPSADKMDKLLKEFKAQF